MREAIVFGLVLLQVLSATEPAVGQRQSLRIEGSTTVGPIADAFAEVFNNRYTDLDITVKKTGSGDGAAALVDGRCDIAIMSRFMKEKEYRKAVENGIFPVPHVVAMDGVCVVVHPSNPVSRLTGGQVRDIYNGRVTNWSELGGPDVAIVAISRDTSSGTYETFHNLVMEKEKMAPAVEYVNSNPQAHARVKTTVGAVGYVGIGFLDANVKALAIDGVSPSRQTIATGQYPVARPLFMFTNGYPKLGGVTYKFCTFYLTETGQEIIEAKGFVPVTNY